MKLPCDFCGKYNKTFRTTYGTSHYIRLMCNSCKKKIEQMDNIKINEVKIIKMKA